MALKAPALPVQQALEISPGKQVALSLPAGKAVSIGTNMRFLHICMA